MSIQHIEDAKILRAYCIKLGRKGIGDRIIQLAREIVIEEGACQSTLKKAGMIRALCIGSKCDSYWDEKQNMGYVEMVYEAKDSIKNNK